MYLSARACAAGSRRPLRKIDNARVCVRRRIRILCWVCVCCVWCTLRVLGVYVRIAMCAIRMRDIARSPRGMISRDDIGMVCVLLCGVQIFVYIQKFEYLLFEVI